MAPRNETQQKTDGKKKRSWPDFALWVRNAFQAIEEEGASKPLSLPSGLYLVATPIGNLGDISLRALWTLRAADAVLCEDTRVTGGLLHQFGIKKTLISCHDHNEATRLAEVLGRLEKGEALALVSDAGTPMISDPGFRLVRACRAAGHPVFALPGASALLTALASAGLPTDRFFFAGFLPSKQTARRAALAELTQVPGTLCFYESPQRLSASLADMAHSLGGGREAAIARELTKMYEEIRTDSLANLAAHYAAADTPKGEIVILVGPAAVSATPALDLDQELRKALLTMSVRDAVAAVVATTGLKKSAVYQRALEITQENPAQEI